MSTRRFVFLLLALFASACAFSGAASADGGMSGTLYAALPNDQPPAWHGGGAGGNYFWFELENQSELLDWPSVPADKIDAKTGDGLSLLLGAWDCGAPFSIHAYPQNEVDNALKVKSELGISNSHRCLLWDNYGPNTLPIADWWSTKGFQQTLTQFPSNEIHSPDPYQSVGVADPDQTIAWNIRIWRQGDSHSMFDRRVGLNVSPSGQDSDPKGISQLEWWRGGITENDLGASGRGGVYSNNNPQAGPLGTGHAADHTRCETRLSTAPKRMPYSYPDNADGTSSKEGTNSSASGPGAYVENTAAWVFNGKHQAVARRKLPSGGSTYGCYWSIDTAGYPETIWLTWTLNKFGGYGLVSYTVVGKPRKMYGILINAISNREALLMPPGDAQGQATAPMARYHNFFRIYVPVPTPVTACTKSCGSPTCTSNCGGPPPAQYESTDEPSLGISVDSDTTVPTRTQSLVTVSTGAQLDSTQAVFGREVQLLHFTPQIGFNGSNGQASYPDAFVRYDSDAGERPFTAWFTGPHSNPEREALLPQPAVPGDDVDTISSNDFRLTWLKPSVENPCPAWGWSRNPSNPWPYRPDACAINASTPIDDTHTGAPLSKLPRNAWSESVSARVLYEARWVKQRPAQPWTPEWQANFPLRCNGDNQINQEVTVTSGACDPSFPLTFYTYSHPSAGTAAINGQQWADGYVELAAGTKKAGDGSVGFRLTTNRPDKVTSAVVSHRDSSDGWNAGDQIDSQSALLNTKSGQPELWYCKPGLPAGANLVTGASAYSTAAAVKVPLASENDQACAGYTVKWNWDWTTNMAPIQADGAQDPQATNCNTLIAAAPGRKNWPVPTFGSLQQYDPSGANSVNQWGQYSMYDGTNPIEGDPNWSTLLSAGGVQWTIPYNGSRPGNPSADGSAYAPGDCYRVIADGRRQPKNTTNTSVKGWVHTGDTSHSWSEPVPDTRKTVTADTQDQLPSDCIPGTIQEHKTAHTSLTTTGTGKKKKTVSKTTYTSTWSCDVLVHHDPIIHTITDPEFSFEFADSGDCHPQTAAQATVLTQAMKNKLVADDKVLYVTQGDVQSTFDSGKNTLQSQSGYDVNQSNDHLIWPRFNTSWSGGLGGCSSAHIPGYITKGGWKLDRGHVLQVAGAGGQGVAASYQTVGDGWGVNQSGPRLDPGDYQVRFGFSSLTAGDLAGNASVEGHSCNSGICWALNADYDGYANWTWATRTHFTQPWETQNTRYVDVFGFRASR